MAEDKEYTGKLTKIVALTSDFSVAEGESEDVYGVSCVHTIKKLKGEDVHMMVAEVPKALADEMVGCHRANLYSDVISGKEE